MKRRNYNIDGQISFFDLELSEAEVLTNEDKFELFRSNDIRLFRTKTIKSGKMLECEIYPLLNSNAATRAKKHKPSRAAQENLNHANAKKHMTRLTNANFTDFDLWGTFGYDDAHLPETLEDAKKLFGNFLKRLKTLYKKHGQVFKYLFVTEWKRDGETVRCHHHVILSGGVSRDLIERTWKCGGYPQTRRLRVKDDCGLTGLASYLAKGKSYERAWGHSRNLKPPVETIADKKISKRRAEKITLNRNDAPAVFEKLYRGYTFRDVVVKRSDYVAGVYIYAHMYRRS